MVHPFVSFDSAEDAMDDSGAPGVSTPEHWSDVGPLSSRLGLVEQQVQSVQVHLSSLSSQMAVMGQSLQQVELQLRMQQKQHEDVMKILVHRLAVAPQDSVAPPRKARPGPRERQRLREAEAAAKPLVKPELEEEPEVLSSQAPLAPETAQQAPQAVEMQHAPQADKLLLESSKGRLCSLWPNHGHGRMSWFAVILLWFLYLATRETALPSLDLEEDLDIAPQPWGARTQDARRLRELGHLQLSVSDCQGAAQLFAKSQEMGNSTLHPEELGALRLDLGFALVCAQRFREAIHLLSQAERMELPVHLLNALGFAHFHLSEVAQASEWWHQALTQAPQNPVLWNNLGAARLLLGDAPGASEALLVALRHAEQLTTATGRYYLQLVSNNIHTQRNFETGQHQSPYQLHVEIFHCVASDISMMVSGTSARELQQQYKQVKMDAAAEGVDVSLVEETRKAVLASEREELLCP